MNNELTHPYDELYGTRGIAAQRRYPNEEFCRFIGSNWLDRTTRKEREKISLLEAGCGSGANLWMAAREGFAAHGLELSREGVRVCREALASWGVSADVREGDMTAMPYGSNSFDIVCDVFSANNLSTEGFFRFLNEARRVLRPGGYFFFYTPSTNSDLFKNSHPSEFIDEYTLGCLKNPAMPFYGSPGAFRFLDPAKTAECMEEHGFSLASLELNGRTYSSRSVWMEFVVCVARAI